MFNTVVSNIKSYSTEGWASTVKRESHRSAVNIIYQMFDMTYQGQVIALYKRCAEVMSQLRYAMLMPSIWTVRVQRSPNFMSPIYYTNIK